MRLLPLAKPCNYIKFGENYRLNGKGFLALPGSISDDPVTGANKYNRCLVETYNAKNYAVNKRIESTFIRYKSNRRITRVSECISGSNPFYINNFSDSEKYLLFQYLNKK